MDGRVFSFICVVGVAAAVQTTYASMTLVPGAAIDLGTNADNQAPSAIAIDGGTAYISMGYAGLKPVNLGTNTVGSAWQQPNWIGGPDGDVRPYNGVAAGGGQVFAADEKGVAVFNTSGAYQFRLSPFTGTRVQTGGVANSLAVAGGVLYATRYTYASGTGDGRVMAAYDMSSPLSASSSASLYSMATGTETRFASLKVLVDQGLATNGAHFMDLTTGGVIGGPFEWRDASGADASKLPSGGSTEAAATLAANGTDGAYAFRAGPISGAVQLYIESLSKVGGVWRHTSGSGTTIDQQYGRIFADSQISLFKADGTTPVSSVRDMEVVGDLLYVSAQGLSVYDISNPLSPVQLARWDATGTTYGLKVYGSTVAIGVNPASGNHVLQLITVPEPAGLALLGLSGLALIRRRRSA